MTRRGVFPGSFNPPTTAHLAIAAAVVVQHDLDHLDLVVSRRALDKEHVDRPLLEHRLAVLRDSVAEHSLPSGARLAVATTTHQLLVDIASGYDVLVMGADKWRQVNDPRYYGDDPSARDAALAALPDLAIVARGDDPVPDRHRLALPHDLTDVSSTAARGGRRELMTPAARRFDDETGAWSDPDRYEAWLGS